MSARMKNPAHYIAGAGEMLQTLGGLPMGHGVPAETLGLVHQRASEINGCAWCMDFGLRHAKDDVEALLKLGQVSGWRESPLFSDAERAALHLAEAMTRLADGEGVPDDVWDEAVKHYDEEAMGALVLYIATTNLYNRLNVTVRQVPGTW